MKDEEDELVHYLKPHQPMNIVNKWYFSNFIRNLIRYYPNHTKVIADAYRENKKIFYESLYWRYITWYMKWKHPSCAKCGKEEQLEVHHRIDTNAYKHLGEEYKNLKKWLQVLCRTCHQEEHDRLEKLDKIFSK